MRYIRNPKSFPTGMKAKDPKTGAGVGDELKISFAGSWLRGLFQEQCWSDGKVDEARTKLEALSRIVDALKGHEADDDEWELTDADHEVLATQALAFNVDGDFSVFRLEFHMFKLAIVSATSKPTKTHATDDDAPQPTEASAT